MESHVYKIISLSEISPEFPYACRYRLRDEALEASIRRRGLLNPLVVTQEAPHAVISGHRRLAAARAAGLERIAVLQLREDLPPSEAYLLALLSNWNQVWTELDRAWALSRAVERYSFSKETVVEEILPCLGLPSQPYFYEEYLQAARLEPGLLDLMAGGGLAFKASKILSRFNREDQRVLARVLSDVPLTLNQLQKAGEWLYDLLKTQGGSLEQFLKQPDLEELLEVKNQDGRFKAERLYQALRRHRFPRLAGKENAFEELSRKIEQGLEEISVEAPASFEAEGLLLHARIRNGEALERVVEGLRDRRKLFNSLLQIVL